MPPNVDWNTTLREGIAARLEQSAKSAIICDYRYLDDEALTRAEQLDVLQEVFAQNIREREISALIAHFAPILRNQPTTSLSCIGKTGTGKTATVLLLLKLIQASAKDKGIKVMFEHLDLSTPRPVFQALNQLACQLNASRKYSRGVSIEEMVSRIEVKLADVEGFIVLFIDEVDHIRGDLDTFLKFLVRRLPQAIPARLILVFASNKLNWRMNVDSRVKSFLKVNEVLFEPYNAFDLQTLLRVRVDKALDPHFVDEGVVELIAALASREHGDARKAVELLSKAARLAEADGTSITEATVKRAYKALELDCYLEFAKVSPVQLQIAMYATTLAVRADRGVVTATDAYDAYCRCCKRFGQSPLSHRRFSDLILELELYGYVRARNVSRGRQGRRKEIALLIPEEVVDKLRETIEMSLTH